MSHMGKLVDAKQRKRIQNRAAQRTYREKVKRRIEDLERWRDVALTFTGLNEDADLTKSHGAIDVESTLNPSSAVFELPQQEQTTTHIDIDALLSVEWSDEPLTLLPTTPSHTAPCFDMQQDLQIQTDRDALTFEEAELQTTGNTPVQSIDNEMNQHACVEALVTPNSSKSPACNSPERTVSSSVGKTALHLAAERNQAGVIHVLLQWMSNFNSKDGQGRTALHSAVALDHIEVVQEMLGASTDGGSVHLPGAAVDINVQDELGQSALHIAAVRGYLRMVELLLQTHQVDIDLKDHEGHSALHRAASGGWYDVVEALLKKGANWNVKVG